jgi:alpha-glucuronidase
MKRRPLLALLAMAWLSCATGARAEDGYDLWLRYKPVEGAAAVGGVTVLGDSPTLQAARAELERGPAGLRGTAPASTRVA